MKKAPLEVAVSPDMQFYNLLESYPYSPSSALCEYIDNSIQAFIDAKKQGLIKDEKLNIEILFEDTSELASSSIVIRDFGAGIDLTNLQNALKPAFKQQKQSLSEFGIGMKAASIWFGRKWELTSYPREKDQGFGIVFDLDDLLSKNLDKIAVTSFNKGDELPGLKIKLSRLKRSISKNSVDEIWRELEETYQYFIYRKNPILKLSVKYNKTGLVPNVALEDYPQKVLKYPVAKTNGKDAYSYGKEKLWRQDVNFEFNGKQVTGFICALQKSSQTDNPGIRLFRYNRLIRGSQHRPYRPIALVGTPNKHAPSRVYGELHLDGQPISNHKGEFLFDETFFLETLKAELGVEEIINQAEDFRAIAAANGKVTHFRDEAEFEAYIKNKKGKENKLPIKPNNPKVKSPRFPKDKERQNPIDLLDRIVASSDHLLLQDVIEEAKNLYEEERWWPFCLCYRIVLEVGILQKLKTLDLATYNACADKGIVGLIKYLSSNLHLISINNAVLIRQLKGKALENIPQLDMMNLASHGNYHPFQSDSELLLKNTQPLLTWCFEDE